MTILTSEQVIALAPDAASVKAGQGLSGPAKWVTLGRNDRSVWGECQGSGKNPYRTQADLSGPAFHCSCPSRKFPCKHGLGLLLLLAADSSRVPEAEAPGWVAEWVGKRDASAEAKVAKAEAIENDPAALARRSADREKRAARRDDRVRAGLDELRVWLGDVMRHGLAHAREQRTSFWDTMAARMVDAQAPGVARRLRTLPGLFVSGANWADSVLAELGRIQWILNGYARLDTLPEGLRASVRTAVGFTVTEQELAPLPSVADRWQIVGQRVEEEERLRVQRTWLVGQASGQHALVLDFAAGNQPLDVSLVPGTAIDADLVYHPSAAPLRATVRERRGSPEPIAALAGDRSFAEAIEKSVALVAGDPWLERTLWCVKECVVLREDEDQLRLCDRHGSVVPISGSFNHTWQLIALCGGMPTTFCGEWDGSSFYPVGVVAEGRLVPLGGGGV